MGSAMMKTLIGYNLCISSGIVISSLSVVVSVRLVSSAVTPVIFSEAVSLSSISGCFQ